LLAQTTLNKRLNDLSSGSATQTISTMAKLTALLLALFVSVVAGFAPRQPTFAPRLASSTELEAAPTMVIY
jgi:hypothetical protein